MNIDEVKIEKKPKIMLMVLPFMTPLNPSQGIACNKSFLQKRGYPVKAVDVMEDMTVREAVYIYFNTLENSLPTGRKGNYFNIALDVLCSHFMAYVNHTDALEYSELVSLIVEKNFFYKLEENQLNALLNVTHDFFTKLKGFLLNKVETGKPDIIGLSVYRGTLPASQFAFQLIRQHFPSIKLIMGGAVFSQELHMNAPSFKFFVEKTLPYIDHFLIGEGEMLLYKFLEGQLPPDKRIYTLEDINHEMLDLNTLDAPDYSDSNLSLYTILPEYTSRGCTFRCSFCAETMYWVRYRKKSASKTVDEMQQLFERYKKRLFLLSDSLVNPVVTALSEEIIRRKLKFYWDVFLKVNDQVCDVDSTLLWRRGGFYRARLGIESGSQRVLDLIDKKITVEKNSTAVSSLAYAGIKPTTYIIVGYPGETEQDFQQSLDWLSKMQDDIYEAECNPFRFYYYGQSHAEDWKDKRKLMYPGKFNETLVSQTWIMDVEPYRDEVFDRVCRFVQHCDKLGIPNPYSVSDIYNADERWKILHKNAVPSVMDLNTNGGDFVDLIPEPVKILPAENPAEENVNFDF